MGCGRDDALASEEDASVTAAADNEDFSEANDARRRADGNESMPFIRMERGVIGAIMSSTGGGGSGKRGFEEETVSGSDLHRSMDGGDGNCGGSGVRVVSICAEGVGSDATPTAIPSTTGGLTATE